MKIAINATCINNRPSGAQQRFKGLYSSLARKMPNSEFVIFEPSDCSFRQWFADCPNISFRPTPIPSEGGIIKYMVAFIYWKFLAKNECFDILEIWHLPDFTIPMRAKILTVHDVRYLYGKKNIKKILDTAVFNHALRGAKKVITVSECMKSEILSFSYHSDINVVYNGLGELSQKGVVQSLSDEFIKKYEIQSGFLLSVGHIEKRKNYEILLTALSLLKDEKKEISVVIIGNSSGHYDSLCRKISEYGLASNVKILSNVSDAELKIAYSTCQAVVFPSLYEGFGIPVIEAMSFEKPIILSDIPVFREITMNNAWFFNPHNAASLVEVLREFYAGKMGENKFLEQNKHRLNDFLYDNIADKMLKLYDDCLKR